MYIAPDDPSTETHNQIGYDRFGAVWGIGLRTMVDEINGPDYEVPERWAFNDAPRQRRLEAIKKIPDLLEKLAEATESLADRVQKEAGHIAEVATAVFDIAVPDSKGKGR